MASNDRSHTAGRFALDIDGYNVGFLKKFSGLAMQADIATNDLGPDLVQKKHVANIKWTPGKATIGIGMGKGMYQWIQQSFKKQALAKTGSFTAGDFDYKAKSRMDFNGAWITSVTVPKLDGSAKEAAYFDVEFDVEQVRWSKGDGKILQAPAGPKQKAWLCSNFRFELDGMPCDRVASIESFTWKQSIAADQIGITREPTKHPAKVTVPDLKLSISSADIDAWAAWAKDWFITGNHEDKHEKHGCIYFLGPDMKERLGRIELKHCGLKSFSEDDAEANSEKIKRFSVELYVEEMEFFIDYADA